MKELAFRLVVCFIVLLLSFKIAPAIGQSTYTKAFAKEAAFIGIHPTNIVSVSKVVPYSAESETLLVVPDTCSFMLTDLTVTPIDPSTQSLISVLSSYDPFEVVISMRAQFNESHTVNMTSGMPFSPETPVLANNPAWGSSDARVTISGYYFGFTQ